jgi:hypothetical protein
VGLSPMDTTAGARAWSAALDQVGQAAARLGEAKLDEAVRRRQQIFETETTARLYDLSNQVLTSEDRGPIGPDGKETGVKGILNQTGKAPHENLQRAMEDADLQANELAKGAQTPAQREWFSATWTRVRQDIFNRATTHASNELTKYEQATMLAALERSKDRAALHAPSGPLGRQVIADEVKTTLEILDKHGPRFGLTGDLLKDEKAKRAEAIYAAAVKGMLVARQHGEANAYWQSVRDQVTDADLVNDIDDLLRVRTTDAVAMTLAGETWATIGPKKDTDTVERDKLENDLRRRTTDTDVLKAALVDLHARMQAWDDGVTARQQRFMQPLYDGIIAGKRTGDVMKMPEWAELSQPMRNQVWDDAQAADAKVDADRERRLDRDWQNRQRSIALADQVLYADYARLSDPARLKGQSFQDHLRDQASLAPSTELQNRLRTAYNAQNNPDGTPAAVTLPEDLVKAVFGEQNQGWALRGTRTSWSPPRQAFFGRVDAAAQALIDAEQRAKGNITLPVERKREIVRQVLTTTVMVGSQWGSFLFNPEERPALDIDPNSTEANRARVPLAVIRQRYDELELAGLPAMLRTYGRDEMNRPIRGSDAAIFEQYRDRIEFAYALREMKAPAEEIQNVLLTGRRR